MLQLYRICRNVYDPKDSTGASKTPGRWHILNQHVLYFGSSLALCILELRANGVSFETIRLEYHYAALEIDTEKFLVEEVSKSFYKKNWTLNRQSTQDYGNNWYKNGTALILKVQSAVLPIESNLILNTTQSDFSRLNFSKPEAIPLDKRVN